MRKKFRHHFVDKFHLHEETTEHGRHYVVENQHRLPSVTTVLHNKTDQTWLLEWHKRVGAAEVKKVMAQSAHRGTAVHAIAERYVLNEEDYIKDAMPLFVDMFTPIKKTLDKHVDDVFGIEIPL